MSATPVSGGPGTFLRKPAVLLLLALLAVAAVVSLLGRLAGGGAAALKKTHFSDEAGSESFPAFSPDGSQVAYSGRASGKGNTFHIFVRPAAGGPARQLTAGESSDIGPAWSPDGQRIAFARSLADTAEYLIIPSGGGAPIVLAGTGPADEGRQYPSVAWMRDGKSILVVMRAPRQPSWLAAAGGGGGEPRKLTAPPAGSEGDTTPAVSPDGSRIAFVRQSTPETGDVWVCDASGANPRRVTFDDHPIRGVAWSADGREIVYAGNRLRGWEIWRIPVAGGSPRRILDAGYQSQFPAVSPKGRKLLYADSPSASALWRADLAEPSRDRPIVRSQGRESSPAFSADGRRIAFRSNRTGFDEIWTAGPDGGQPVQVTHLGGPRLGRPRWSPDGTTVVFDSRQDGGPDLYVVPASGGKATRITASRSSSPVFSPDGKWIYHGQQQIWRITPDGGRPEQLTRQGGSGAAPSPDGRWIYYQRGREIRRVPAEGGDEQDLYTPENGFLWGSLAASNEGVYFLEYRRQERKLQLGFYEVKTRRTRPILELDRAGLDQGVSFDVSPDGKSVVYTKVDQTETNLVLLDGFR